MARAEGALHTICLPDSQADAIGAALIDHVERERSVAFQRRLADALGAGIDSAIRQFKLRKGNSDEESWYQATVGRFLACLGCVYGCKIFSNPIKSSRGKSVFAYPDGDELWVVTRLSSHCSTIEVLAHDRALMPDLKTDYGLAEIKTPKSLTKVSARLSHAKEQLGFTAGMDGMTLLSLLRIDDTCAAKAIAVDCVRGGRAANVWLLHVDGVLEGI